MSTVDLKGNTNFLLIKNTDGEYVAPRTNLAAIDMITANGIHAANNVLSLDCADPLQLTIGAAGTGVVNSTVLGIALKFARNSVFDIDSHSTTYTGIGIVATEENDEHRVTAIPQDIGGTLTIGLTLNGPLPVVSETASKYLVVVEVKTEDLPAASITISSTGTQIPVANYGTISTTTNVWTRLAFVLDTTSQSYTDDIKLTAVFPTGTGRTSLVYRNLYIVSVIDLLPAYIAELTSVIGTPNAYLLKPGEGIAISDGTISTMLETADAKTVLDGEPDMLISTKGLIGALTAGQAVDVTSAPDGVTGDYLGRFTVTGSSLGFAAFPKYAKNLNYLFIATIMPTTTGTVTPSANCKWLDTGNREARSVAAGISVKLAVTFTSTANTCPASFALSGTGTVTVSNCRQYEVTACTADAIAYIASLSNPDTFADYYLVKADMVQPWTYIIDMGDSPAVTIAAGLSYKLNATTGTHTLTVDTCPEGYDGRDAIIRIRLGGNGVVQAVAPLQLGDALVPYAINNCVVRYRDGEAVLLVEDTLAGYVVTVTSGIVSGSLSYGLAATGVPYIAFSTGTDGYVVDMGSAVTANEEVTVVGNGYTNTTVTGNITCTNKTTVANLSLQDVTVTGGTLTLGDAYIPSGSTVAVSVGGLTIEKVAGDGGVIDLGGNPVYGNGSFYGVTLSGGTLASGSLNVTGEAVVSLNMSSGTSLAFSGSNTVELISGSLASVVMSSGAVLDLTGNTNPTPVTPGSTIKFAMGGATVIYTSGAGSKSYFMNNVTLHAGAKLTNVAAVDLGGSNVVATSNITVSGCTISGGSATTGGAMFVSKGKSADVTSCVFAGNSATGSGGAIYNATGTVNLTGCTFANNYSPVYGLAVLNTGGVVYLNGCAFGAGQSVTNTGAGATTIVSGSCAVGGTLNKQGSYGTLLISAGAIIDATGNTNNTIVIQSANGCKIGSGTPDNWVVNGTATFKNSAGASVVLEGAFTAVTKAGVIS